MSHWLKPYPDPLPERLSEKLKCKDYFDKFLSCRGGRSQVTTLYESGGIRSCKEEWEEFRWCFKAKFFGSEMARKRLAVRRRNVYTTLDKMPWIYRQEYLQYLQDEHRLPKRFLYLLEDVEEVE